MVPFSTPLPAHDCTDPNSLSNHSEGEELLLPIPAVHDSTIMDSLASVFDYCYSVCSLAKAALRQQTPPKTGSLLCCNILRALFSYYQHSALSVVVTVPVP